MGNARFKCDRAAGAAAAFDTDFLRRAPEFSIRPETVADTPFLNTLFLRCSPLAALLPGPMLLQQAALQCEGHRAQHPYATGRIVLVDRVPMGRILVDWSVKNYTHCVDIAVLPDRRSGAAGLHLLRAWTAVADAGGMTAGLTVQRDNPARRIYARIGFVPLEGADLRHPLVEMRRPCLDPGVGR